MFFRALVSVLVIGMAYGQPAGTSVAGSIRGTIRDLGTGIPLAQAQIQLIADGKQPVIVVTDSQGGYIFHDVDPGPLTLRVFPPGNILGNPPLNRTLRLGDKQDLTGIDIKLRAQGEITGRVTNEAGNALAGIVVWLVAREYSLGELKYILTFRGRTDEAGEYTIRGVNPGRAYILLAAPLRQITNPVSGVPSDPERRKPVVAPTYYPGTDRAEGGLPVAIRPGERREHMDIRMIQMASFCAEGVVQSDVPDEPMRFELTSGSGAPVQGRVRTVTAVVNFSLLPQDVLAGPDGRFRVCELPPGNYRLSAYSSVPVESGPPTVVPRAYGSTEFAIVDRDVKEITVTAMPWIRVRGQIEWTDSLPATDGGKVTIRLLPLGRMARKQEALSVAITAGAFSFDQLMMGEYAVQVEGLPPSTYMKDLLYAGRSVLASPLRVGSVTGSPDLRLILGRNGGYLNVRVTDRDNNAIPDTTVAIVPANAASPSALSELMKGGATGQTGNWVSPPLAPGKYVVLTTPSVVDFSPESLVRVLGARTLGRDVEIAPGGTVDLTLSAALLE